MSAYDRKQRRGGTEHLREGKRRSAEPCDKEGFPARRHCKLMQMHIVGVEREKNRKNLYWSREGKSPEKGGGRPKLLLRFSGWAFLLMQPGEELRSNCGGTGGGVSSSRRLWGGSLGQINREKASTVLLLACLD